MHETFCEWEKSDRQIDTCEYFEARYDAYIDEKMEEQPDLDLWQVPPGSKNTQNVINNYRKRGLERDVPEYTQRCLEAKWEVYRFPNGEKALELDFEVDLSSVTVKGSIDRIQWWPDKGYATIEDLKTGNLDDDEWDRRQLGLYAYGARSLGIPLKYGRYWFTKLDRGSEWFDLTKYDAEFLGKQYAQLDTAIGLRIFLPNPGKQCILCSVKDYCPEQGNQPIPEES